MNINIVNMTGITVEFVQFFIDIISDDAGQGPPDCNDQLSPDPNTYRDKSEMNKIRLNASDF